MSQRDRGREDARALLQAHGLRVTAPRLAVLDLLSAESQPLTHTAVVDRLAHVADPATIYRNLVKLTENGLARIASRAEGMAHYELVRAEAPAHENHPHFVCSDCGTVSCLPEDVAPKPQARGRWRKALKEANIQLEGTCPDCLDELS
ncbi:MAG: Fur family transcriptional regulator [Myxococcota bacterium]